MKYISHRGNTSGINLSLENTPDYIESAINKGFDVEIDLWYNKFDENFYLGHDEPKCKVDWFWLAKYSDKLWVHCKNIECLLYFSTSAGAFNYFWHENDSYALTSKNYIWTYPGKSYTPNSIVVMPEFFMKGNLNDVKVLNCFGICSDYVETIR